MNLEVQYVNATTLGLNYDNITVYEKNNDWICKRVFKLENVQSYY